MSDLIVPIVEVESVTKHPGADTLDILTFKGYGWQSIVKIGQYKVGDHVVFVPPDCLLPDWIIQDQQVEYLKGDRRTRTVKLRKELSQGMVMPIDVLTRIPVAYNQPDDLADVVGLGCNVANMLGISKYEPPVPEYQQNTGPQPKKDRPYNSKQFPAYTHIQHYANFTGVIRLEELVAVLEKIHGTNFRAGWVKRTRWSLWDRIKRLFGKTDEWVFTCGSHNVEMPLEKRNKTSWYNKAFSKNIYQQTGRLIKDLIPKGYIVYGEIYGPKIQDLTYGLSHVDYVIFDVMESETLKYLDFEAANEFVQEYLSTTHKNRFVPVIEVCPFDPDKIIKLASGDSILAGKNGIKQIREGVVVKPIHERSDPVLGRVILKFISPEYATRKQGTEFK